MADNWMQQMAEAEEAAAQQDEVTTQPAHTPRTLEVSQAC